MEYRTEKEILQTLIQKAEEKNLINIPPEQINEILEGNITENQYILDLSVHAYINAQLEQMIQETSNNTNIDQATGRQLDNIGTIVNVPRHEGKQSILDITIENTSTEPITIPQQTSIEILNIAQNGYNYYTSQETTIQPNTTETITCECEYAGYVGTIPENSVTNITGYQYIKVTNNTNSTTGSDIEEDDTYRERIKKWASQNMIGTKQKIQTYLDQYTGIDYYNLIPLYDGVGTLKIIIDGLPSIIPTLTKDVYNNCMLYTDHEPLIELVQEEHITNIELYAKINMDTTLTQNEITQIIRNMCKVYVQGGLSRTGNIIKGISVGGTLNPSQLTRFLLEQIPEINNVYSTRMDPVTCPPTKKLIIDNVSVNVL